MLTESERWERECRNKLAFKSKAKALKRQRQDRSVYGGERLSAYRCTWCESWHLGHAIKNPWETKRVAS